MQMNYEQLKANNELLAETISYMCLGAKDYKELAKTKTGAKNNEKINKYVIGLDKFLANLKQQLKLELEKEGICQK